MSSTLSKAPDILLATEGTYPFSMGGVSEWADRLISGLHELSFSVFALVSNPHTALRYRLPQNVVSLTAVPLWGTEEHDEYSGAPGRLLRQLRPPRRKLSQLLEAYAQLLDAVVDPSQTDLLEVTASLEAVADFAGSFSLRRALRRREVWQLLSDRLRRNSLLQHLTMTEAVEFGRLLYRYLGPLAYPTPVARVSHSSAAAFCAMPLVVLRQRYGVPLLLTEHGVYYRERLLALGAHEGTAAYRHLLASLYSLVTRLSYTNADRIAPVALFNSRWETSLGVDPEVIEPVPNGGDGQRFFAQRAPGSGNGPLRLVQLARIDPLKDIHNSIFAMAELTSMEQLEPALAGVTLTIYGPEPDPEYARSCYQLTEQLGLDKRIFFAGPTRDSRAALEQADIAILSSISEGFPLAAVESLMAERPLVATAVGGMEEIVRHPYGRLVAPRRPRELAEAVLDLARQRDSSPLLGTLARSEMQNRFSQERFLAAYRELYLELGVTPAPTGDAE